VQRLTGHSISGNLCTSSKSTTSLDKVEGGWRMRYCR
jgi:hypothetical protein